MLGKDLLVYLSIKYKGDFKRIVQAIHEKEKVDEEVALGELKKIKSKYITVLDDAYPDELRHIYMPPLVLFYKGDISLLKSAAPRLGVIGSRECTEYGSKMTKELVSGVIDGKKDNPVIVSGGARGIDTIALDTCLNNKGKTIAVLGSGLERLYPSVNKEMFEKIAKTGLLITEYPDMVEAAPDNFPARNRLVAGISNKILVTEAYKNSGTNITVLYALRQGKDVMAVPSEAGKNSACNRLIQDGAFLVENVDDLKYLILDHYGINHSLKEKKPSKEKSEPKQEIPEMDEPEEMEVE